MSLPSTLQFLQVFGTGFEVLTLVRIHNWVRVTTLVWHMQGRPLGGVNGALALGADLEGAPKRQSPTGHTLICSTLAWWFSHLQTKRVAKNFFKIGCIGFSLFWCVLAFTYVHSRYALCLLLQILLVAALDINTRDIPTVSPINSLLSQYCKASHYFFQIFMSGGGGATGRFVPVCPWENWGKANSGRPPPLPICKNNATLGNSVTATSLLD
jgi:hypothetical protein